MDIFSTQIVAAIKKIRTQKGRPDSAKIFKEVVKESATNITLEDIQQALQHMVSDGKLINAPHKGLDSYYVVDTQSVEVTCCEDINFQKNPTPNNTDSFPSLNISVETPKIDSTECKSSLRDSSQDLLAQVVAMKAYFMNETYELKNEICCLKNKLEDREKRSDSTSMANFYKSEISLLKDQNSFLKSELQQRQVIVEKLLDLQQKDQSKINRSNQVQNKHDNSRSNFDNTNFDKNLTVKNKSLETPHSKVTRKTTFNRNNTKVIVVGDSITKFLRSDELSTSERSVTVMKHPGCSTEDMTDYIKPMARKKPDTILLHVGTNDLTKGINTMKNVRKCVEAIRELDNSENIQIGFSSIVHRSDKDFSKEISELNVKMKKYCLGRGFIYIDNDNINESCLNNSKLHLNKKGTSLFSKKISTSLDVI